MRDQLARAAVRLYPRHVRDRYGEEISGLLAASHAPGRDLLNVVWWAVGEHVAAFSFSRLARAVLRLAGLALLPLVTAAAWLMLSTVGLIIGRVSIVFGEVAEAWFLALYFGVPAAVLVPLAVVAGRRWGRGWPAARSVVLVPACLAAGAVGVVSIPQAGVVMGERWQGSAAAIGVWFAGLVAVGIGYRWMSGRAQVASGIGYRWMSGRAPAAEPDGERRMSRRVPGWLVWVCLAVAAFVVLDVAHVVYLRSVFTGTQAPWAEAPLWFPLALVGQDSGDSLAGRSLLDTLKALPHVLTVMTVFTLAWFKRPRPAPTGVVKNSQDLVAA
ncbi:MAG TPA: hypothetical protein VF062_23725 [Candidatus Limnocylindrales bacterium]